MRDATRASQGANKEWATIAEWHEASPARRHIPDRTLMGKTRCYFLAVTWDAMKIGTLSAAPAMATNNRASQKLRVID